MQGRKVIEFNAERRGSGDTSKVGVSAGLHIDQNLRRAFSIMEKEPVPQQFHALIAQLREKDVNSNDR